MTPAGPLRHIIEQAKQLPVEERRAVIRELEASLAEAQGGSSTSGTTQPSYRGWLELSGAFHSDYTDVSANKGKHLADVLYGRRATDD